MRLEIISSILLSSGFESIDCQWTSDSSQKEFYRTLRLYCKSLEIDENISIMFDQQLNIEQESLLTSQIRQNHILEHLSAKKCWTRLRTNTRQMDKPSREVFSISMLWNGLTVIMQLNYKLIIHLYRLLSIKNIPRDRDALINLLQQEIFYKIYDLPLSLVEDLFTKDESTTQKMILNLLSGDIVSLDMFASFILDLGKDLQIWVLTNCSASIRKQLEQKIRQQKSDYSISWKKISWYILKRNFLSSCGDLIRHFPEIALFYEIRSVYLAYRLEQSMQDSVFKDTLEYLVDQGRMESLMMSVDNKSIIATDILFPDLGLASFYSSYFSAKAFEIFMQDKAYLSKSSPMDLYECAIWFIRKVYGTYFENQLSHFDIKQELTKNIHDARSIEIIADEVGIVCFLQVMQDMPLQWRKQYIKGALALLYTQWEQGLITINHLDKWSRQESRERFLMQYLILSHEGRIASAFEDQSVTEEPV